MGKLRKRIEIAPALLCKNRAQLLKRLSKIQPYAKRAQIDIMDGKFVRSRTVQPKQLAGIKPSLKLEVQLMVKDPAKYVLDICKMNAWMIIFHYESFKDKKKIIDFIHTLHAHKYKVGIAINPETSAAKVKPFLKFIDLVLVMTVHPGFGGRKFLTGMLPKIRQLRRLNKNIDIEVDGGIHHTTAPLAVKAGANVLVAGTEIFGRKDVRKGFQHLRNAIRGA